MEQDNNSTLLNIYNTLTIAEEELNYAYGRFDWDVDYESMAKYLVQKETRANGISFNDIEDVEILDQLPVYDENEIAFGRAYNFRALQSEDEVYGYIVISTHTKRAILLKYEEDAQISDTYEKLYYLQKTLYYYSDEVYYDLNGAMIGETPPVALFGFLQGDPNPNQVEEESMGLIEELNDLINEYVNVAQFEEEPNEGQIMLLAASAADWPIIYKGSNGTLIKALEYLLKQNGYSVTVDTTFTTGKNSTESAVKSFQKKYGLAQDGKAGPNTLAKLVSVTGTIQKGSGKSSAVKAVQTLLSGRYSINLGNVDGDFGDKTLKATKDFQQWKGITKDGKVGATTWKYLFGSPQQKCPGSGGGDNPGGGNIPSNGTIAWPCPSLHKVNSEWGFRAIDSNPRFHYGIDIPCGVGTAIVAAMDGKVTFSGQSGAAGQMITISHSNNNGYNTVYMHQSKRIKKYGDTVKKGDVIGYSGRSGKSPNSYGAHLHFELRRNSAKKTSVNPIEKYHRHDKRSGKSNPNPAFIIKNGKYVFNTNFKWNYSDPYWTGNTQAGGNWRK